MFVILLSLFVILLWERSRRLVAMPCMMGWRILWRVLSLLVSGSERILLRGVMERSVSISFPGRQNFIVALILVFLMVHQSWLQQRGRCMMFLEQVSIGMWSFNMERISLSCSNTIVRFLLRKEKE